MRQGSEERRKEETEMREESRKELFKQISEAYVKDKEEGNRLLRQVLERSGD